MISFVHSGDIHLGLQFNSVSFDKDKARFRREELWTSFQRIVEFTRDNNIDFLLLAGDIFEDKYFTLSDTKRLRDILNIAKDVNILIGAGNHDYIRKNSLYESLEWGKHVTIFPGGKISYKDFHHLKTRVYGFSWDRQEIEDDSIFKDFPQEETDYKKILLIHGDLDASSKYLPLKMDKLKALGMDYIALGHIHKPEIFSSFMAYCGCPEPLNFGEAGERGFIKGKIANGLTSLDFIPFSKRNFIIINLEVEGHMSYQEIMDMILSSQEGNRGRDFYRIIIRGLRDREIDLFLLEDSLKEDFYYMEVKDETSPNFNLEELEDRYKDNIIASFIREMKAKDLENPQIKEALNLGLNALLRGLVE